MILRNFVPLTRFHSDKEQWEPTIERVFQLQRSKDKFHKIREVWAFDWQNHGDAAVLNQDALGSRPQGVCRLYLAVARISVS